MRNGNNIVILMEVARFLIKILSFWWKKKVCNIEIEEALKNFSF